MSDLLISVKKYLKRHFYTAVLWAGVSICFATIFYLYGLPLEAVGYAALLSACLLAGAAVAGFIVHYSRHRKLLEAESRIFFGSENLPEPRDQIEEDYGRIIESVLRDRAEQIAKEKARRTEMTEYYTTWGHQIKTPLAAMRLLLQSGMPEGSAEERAEELLKNELSEELQKTERYVDMALQYVRLDSGSSDFLFRKYSLDDMIRRALREYAGLFIRKHIALDYRETGAAVVTDEKWLLFVIGQILSNSLKYTDSGKISIYASQEEEGIFLIIEDTGIGIAPEDLHRVFEKGFTGGNGRENRKSTGLGLYLCRRILKKLSHTIEIESEPGTGTKVKIGIQRYEIFHPM